MTEYVANESPVTVSSSRIHTVRAWLCHMWNSNLPMQHSYLSWLSQSCSFLVFLSISCQFFHIHQTSVSLLSQPHDSPQTCLTYLHTCPRFPQQLLCINTRPYFAPCHLLCVCLCFSVLFYWVVSHICANLCFFYLSPVCSLSHLWESMFFFVERLPVRVLYTKQ